MSEPGDVWQPPAPGAPPPPPEQQAGGQQAWAQQGWQQPGPYPPGQGWAPKAGTSAWAIVSLVTAVLALVPVAVVCGIVALRKTKRGTGGKGLAIAGLAVSGAWVLVLGGLLAIGLLVGHDSGNATLGRLTDEGSSTVGACLQQPDGDGSVSTVTDCSSPHDGEVFATSTLPAGSWPGYDAVAQQADDGCALEFEGYVGESYDSSSYDYGFFVPDEAEWLAGEHRVVCVILPGDADQLVGSVHDGSGSTAGAVTKGATSPAVGA